jgi:hypothetical protein
MAKELLAQWLTMRHTPNLCNTRLLHASALVRSADLAWHTTCTAPDMSFQQFPVCDIKLGIHTQCLCKQAADMSGDMVDGVSGKCARGEDVLAGLAAWHPTLT